MMEVSIPDEWAVIEYGDVLTSVSNGIGGKQNKDGSGIPVSRIETIAHETINFSRVGFIEIYDTNKVEKYKINKGDILFSHINSPTHLGKTAIFDKDRELYHGINLLRLVVNKKCMIARFFNYHCKFSRKAGIFSQNAQHAVNQSSINQKKLSRFKVPLPPLAEQKIIADKLDSLLAQVENTKARLERIPEVLKRFRQSVLAAAVSGRLTEEWRELFEEDVCFSDIQAIKKSLIQSKQIKKDLVAESKIATFSIPVNWLFLALQSVATKITDGEHKTPKREISGRYLLSARNIRDGYISTENVDFIGEEEFNRIRKRCDPNSGDILISCSGSVGRISLVDKDDTYAMVRSAAQVRVLNDFIDSQFLMFALQSPMIQKNIAESSKSTAQSNLFLGPIKGLGIPLPPLAEQTEIVRRVDQLFAYTDTIERQVNSALEHVNQLTQSILAKAFRGELTEQWRKDNPELTSGENSAEALLEKIKAERAAKAPKKTSRKKAFS